MKYPLGYNTWDKRELKAINKVLMSGQYVMSKNVLNFEKQFANYFGSKHAVMVNSGSSANLLMMYIVGNALMTLQVRPPDRAYPL